MSGADGQDKCKDYNYIILYYRADDPANAASCTRDFVSPGVIPLLALIGIVRPNNQQIVFPSHIFTSDGSITGWTLAAQWVDEAGRNRFPELQIWRRRMSNPNIYDRIASTLLTAALESSNQLYSDTIDPPLPFQSGDVLGMYLPIDGSNGARLLVNFGIHAGSLYETRNIAVPLSSIVLGQEVDNDRVFLALETSECTTHIHSQCSVLTTIDLNMNA